MMSYPAETSKGKYISWFWGIFNLGGVIGALVSSFQWRQFKGKLMRPQVPLAQNIGNESKGGVNTGTYIGFLVLTFAGALLAWVLVDARHVVRTDGSRIILMKNPTWKSELLGLWETLFTDPYILCLFPMFFASNWFYAYQFNSVNKYFNVRTAALNNILYWIAQIFGAAAFGLALDTQMFRRTTRAIIGWCVLFALTFAVWGGGYVFQTGYTRMDTGAHGFKGKDWTDAGYLGPMFLYIAYGFYDAAWQTCVYWSVMRFPLDGVSGLTSNVTGLWVP